MKAVILVLTNFLAIISSYADTDSICLDSAYIKTNLAERSELLVKVKAKLTDQASKSIENLRHARNYLFSCRNEECKIFQDQFLGSLSEQVHISKVIKAIVHKSNFRVGPKSKKPMTLKVALALIRDQKLEPEHVANFNIEGFSFSVDEKHRALRLWTNIFVRLVNTSPNSTYRSVKRKTDNYFKQLSYDYLSTNPLLAFVTEADLNQFKNLRRPFEKMIEFNKEFLEQVGNYKSFHKTSFWSYLNLTSPDHEMGLVNFSEVISDVIELNITSNSNKITLCSAWIDLKRQQKIRIRSSIGVGFGTAFLCGVGVWSGIGTLPAASLCSFAIADGLWGARRGSLDNNMAKASQYAGVKMLDGSTFSEGVFSPETSARKAAQGQIVFLINMLGLVPVGKAIAATAKSGRGGFLDLFKIPGSDLTVSTLESASSNLAYATLVIRGSEAIQNEFKEEISRMVWLALSV